MKPLPVLRRRIGVRFPLLAYAGALLATAGCGQLEWLEDVGDRDAKQSAAYRVTVNPTEIVLTPANVTVPVKVAVEVECVGKNVPDDCSKNDPNWTCVLYGGPTSLLDLRFDDRHDASTYLDVYLADKYSEQPLDSLAEGTRLTIRPQNVPDKMRLTGQLGVTIRFQGFPSQPPERNKEPESTPRLVAFPNSWSGTASRGQALEFMVIYKGPPTGFMSVVMSGHNASDFFCDQSIRTLQLGKYSVVRTFVRFDPVKSDSTFRAMYSLITDNFAAVNIPITVTQ